MNPTPLRILLADDHALVRAGTRAVLSSKYEANFSEACTAQETVEAICNDGPWSLIILDINMPGRSGLDIVADLKKCAPKTPILVMSAHGEEHFATRALKAGAAGYLSKMEPGSELLKGVEKVLAGGQYVSEKFAEMLALLVRDGGQSSLPHETLSAREFEVLRMIVEGKSGKEIAADLSISFKTVSTYRGRVMQKLGVNSTAQLVHYANREGVV